MTNTPQSFSTDPSDEEFNAKAVATLDDQEFTAWLQFIADDQGDVLCYLFDELDALNTVLTPERMYRLCTAFDVCTEHLCDIEICADDADDCPAGRGELQ